MVFCQNCGNQLADDAKFCSNCGTPAGIAGTENVRKQEYVGSVKKCPNCGAVVASLNAVCTSCGHEFVNTKVDKSVKEFFDKISDLSDGYETKQDEEKNSMFLIGRIMCVLVAFLCSYFVVYEGWDGAKITGILLIIIAVLLRPPLTQQEKKKRSLIETYVVPNNKESIIEFLILSCSQIQPGANPITKEGKNISLWNKVWKTKIRQTITKTKVVLVGDKDAQEKIALIKKQYRIR